MNTQGLRLILTLIFIGFLPFNGVSEETAVSSGSVSQSPSDYEGTWKVEHPQAGLIYLIIWEEGRASYFFTANPRVEVFSGSWELSDSGMKINWQTGGYSQLRFVDGDMDIVFAAQDPEHFEADRTVFPATRVPRGELGKWARPPGAPDRRSAEGLSTFFGNWSAERPDGSRFFIVVEEDRTAASTFRHRRGEEPIIQRGVWRRIGSDLHITWNDGAYARIVPRSRGHDVIWFEPGVLLEGDDREVFNAIRVQVGLPQDWLTAYREKRYLGVNVAVHRQRNQVSRFFRGFWDIAVAREEGSYIEIRRFSNARTNRFGGVTGRFFPQPDSLTINWENGIREVIQPVGIDFVVTTFRPGQPLDGQPERVFPLIPREEGKLESYREDKRQLFRFD